MPPPSVGGDLITKVEGRDRGILKAIGKIIIKELGKISIDSLLKTQVIAKSY